MIFVGSYVLSFFQSIFFLVLVTLVISLVNSSSIWLTIRKIEVSVSMISGPFIYSYENGVIFSP